MSSIKEEAKRLIDKLPEETTWDDIMYEIYVKKKIDIGIITSRQKLIRKSGKELKKGG